MHEHLLRGKAALGQLLKQLTHQRLGPVGDRLGECLVAHAHDAQLELLHRAPAEGGLAWVGSGLRDRV